MKDFIANLKELKTKDVVIALLIMALPFLFFTYELTPMTQSWETSLFTINAGAFEEVLIWFYFFNIKLLIILSLIIWYFTCKHWWKNAILVPLIIELFKLRTFLNPSMRFIDEIEFFQSLPMTIPIIGIIVFVSKKTAFSSKYIDLSNELNQEIENILKEINRVDGSNHVKIKLEFENLKKNKKNISLEVYNNELHRLRERLNK